MKKNMHQKRDKKYINTNTKDIQTYATNKNFKNVP